MKCNNCGAELNENTVCPSCGAYEGQTVNEPLLSEKEYYDAYADKQVKSNYKWTMIISFITAGVSLVSVLLLGNIFAIFDCIFYLVIGILMINNKNWVLPLLVAIVGGIGSLIGMAMTGTPSGIVALIVAITATVKMKGFHKEYIEYKNRKLAERQ